jgi:hypothetical protein
MDRNVEMALAHIDSGTSHAMITHLRRPCLGYEPQRFTQPHGPEEELVAILLPTALKGSEDIDPTTSCRTGGHPSGKSVYLTIQSSKRIRRPGEQSEPLVEVGEGFKSVHEA